MAKVYISVQKHDFDISHEYATLREDNRSDGAIVFFSGLVREMNQGSKVSGLSLEHYPGMTEKALHAIVDEAITLPIKIMVMRQCFDTPALNHIGNGNAEREVHWDGEGILWHKHINLVLRDELFNLSTDAIRRGI